MRRLTVLVAAVAVVCAAVALSRNQSSSSSGDMQVQVEERNPWTHLRLNNNPDEFRFAVVSDRTGGHRPGIFSRAVEQINLMQPEFVLSVGDLIEGYSQETDRVAAEWKEFQSFVSRLDMPFFYVPGNHDVTNPAQGKLWKEKFGRCYYHFVYRNVLFLILNSDDPPGKPSQISEEQSEWVKKTLAENAGVRWTIVSLHKPLWTHADVDKNGWLNVEKALAGRKYTVFAGHVHRYQKFVRNGMNYYQLATTGGGSRMRGIDYGEFDHIAWITMKNTGPVIANVMLNGILPEDLRMPVTAEPGARQVNRKATHPTRGTVYFEGAPAVGAEVVFHLIDPATKKLSRTGDAVVGPDGNFVMSTYASEDGAPAGDFKVTVTHRKPRWDELGKPGPNTLPERYADPEKSGLTATIKAGKNEVTLDLKR